IVLGPYAGFLSTLLGVLIGHCIYFRDPYEFVFTFGAPTGAMMSGFLFRGEWKPVLTYYTALLAGYCVAPVAWQLPVWGMWNVYCACLTLLATAIIIVKKRWKKRLRTVVYVLALCSFIGLEADVLFRIFVFVPCQTFRLFYGWNTESLFSIWVAGACITPVKVAIGTLFAGIIGPPLIRVLGKIGLSSYDFELGVE
ncbi:MAG: hypothetical protein U9O89_01000, partial [Thermoproteota archaeon]|nr:hypothetical protein [Thermoproteota archaeon]